MKNKKYLLLSSSLLTALILLAIFIYYGFAPFGSKTLATNDANIQYLDFYAYYKNALSGNDSFVYSFAKSLGGNMIAVFSYYLSSPFVLLSLLFRQEDLYTYYNICVLLKLSLAAYTFSYYLYKRFKVDLENKTALLFIIILSLGYSLSQYSLAQSCNIMWLDGVYMLPLILLFVSEVVNEDKKAIVKLSIVVGLNIIFNWYIGAINCIFSFFWLIFELLLRKYNNEYKKREVFLIFAKYVLSMLIGVMLSAFLLLPSAYALTNSTRGELNINLLSLAYDGDILSYISKYAYGQESIEHSVSLFAGLTGIIGFICTFLDKNIKKEKIVYLLMFIFLLLMFYWNPLYTIFSLFKGVGSYWYRYSYLGIFIFLFISSKYYLNISNNINYKLPIYSSLIFSISLIVLNILNNNEIKIIVLTAFASIIIGVLISFLLCNNKANKTRLIRTALLVVVVFDMAFNAKYLMNNNCVDDLDGYKDYVLNMNDTINKIKQADEGIYRILKTSARIYEGDNTTSNYNEPLAYNYMSISSYTSSPDDNVRNLLNNMGYIKMGENASITTTPILPVDSLFGVKYIVSSYPIDGLNKIDETIYENQYALPLAFTYSGDRREITTSNPFEYVNNLYSKLLGREVTIFERLDYILVQEGDQYVDIPKVYEINVENYKDYAVYVNFPSYADAFATLTINNKYTYRYSDWFAPSVVYIPMDSDTATIELSTNKSYGYFSDSQFYKVNLNEFKEIIDELNKENISIKINKTNIEIDIDDNIDDSLLVSIPYDKGWSIKVNGKKAEYSLIGDCLYSIKLSNENNHITMSYSAPYLKEGIVISLIGIITLWIINKRINNVIYNNKI